MSADVPRRARAATQATSGVGKKPAAKKAAAKGATTGAKAAAAKPVAKKTTPRPASPAPGPRPARAPTDPPARARGTEAEVWSAASRMGRSAQIGWLRAVEVHAEDHGKPDPEARELPKKGEVDLAVGLRYSRSDDGRRVFYDVKFELEAPPTAKAPGAVVRVVFRVQVTLPRGFDPSADEIEAYGESTIALTAYPYFREAYQSLTARLGRRPATLGVLTAPLVGGTVEDTDDD